MSTRSDDRRILDRSVGVWPVTLTPPGRWETGWHELGIRRFQPPAPGHRSERDDGVARLVRRHRRGARAQPGPLPADATARAGPGAGSGFPATVSTPYINTIPPEQEPWFPGDEYMERRIRAFIRWNAAVMVARANHLSEGIGGHLATFASLGLPLRGRLQPLLPGQGRRHRRRSGVLPGPRRPGHLRPGLPGGSSHRGAPGPLPDGGRAAAAGVCRRTPTPA